MSKRMRITSADRLVVKRTAYRLSAQTSSGYLFEEVAKSDRQISYTFEELDALFLRSDVSFEPGHFLKGRTDVRQSSNVIAVGCLPEDKQAEVVWRHAFVTGYLDFAAQGVVRKTDDSIAAILPRIEAHVNAQARAAQSKWQNPRAGRKNQFRDPPCAKTLRTWVKRFEDADCSPLALVPRTHRSGNRDGRFCLETTRILGECTGAYLTRQRLSKKQVSDLCRDRFRRVNEERAGQGKPTLSIPSRRSVERAISRLDPYYTYVRRHGVDAANRKFVLYEEGISARYPMERIEIDEWKVDLITVLAERGALDHLSDDELACLDRGRRWLYVAIDSATRCIVGMRLAQVPNSDDAIALLVDITRDKTALAQAAGCSSTWHHFGGLNAVVTDSGTAFANDLFQTAIFDAHGKPEIPAGGLPHLRGKIERVFRTFGTSLMPHLAGRTFSSTEERGDYPSEKLASLNDEALMQVLVLYVVDVYHNTPHRGLRGETPNNCWKRLATEKGVVPALAEITRRRAFGQRDRRTVTGRGVQKFGIDYSCAALREFHLHNHENEVDIRFDVGDLGWILVQVDSDWHVAQALQKCFDGVSYDEWERAARELRYKYKAEAELHEQSAADAIRKIIEINASEQRRFDTVLKEQTPAGLLRARDSLFLGLSIVPDEGGDFELPPEPDLFGHIIPSPDQVSRPTDLTNDQDSPRANEGRTGDWSFDDDE